MPNTQKFCTGCGSPLEPGQKLCNHCGTPTGGAPKAKEDSTATKIEDEVTRSLAEDKTRALNSLHEVGTTPTSPQTAQNPAVSTTTQTAPKTTQVIPSVSPTQRNYIQSSVNAVQDIPNQTSAQIPATYQVQPQNNSDKTKRKIMIGVIIGLAVVIIALLVIFLAVPAVTSQGNSDPKSQPSEQTQSNSSNSSGSSSSTPKVTTSARDKEIYNKLIVFYNKLDAYDSKISSAATTFNNNYLKKDLSTRSDCAGDAYDLFYNVSTEYSNLYNLDVPTASEYYDSYNKLLTCYYDCEMRISVICDAWDISLTYTDPTGHEKEICKPLEDTRVNDNNKYYTEYKQVYPTAKPAAPRG